VAKKWHGRRCPVCSEGTLHDGARRYTADYRGEEFSADQAGAYCDNCGDGIVFHDPTFDQKWDDFRAKVDKEQAEELAALRADLGITQEVASRISGGGHNAFSRYERQEAQPVIGVLKLFRILRDLITHDPALLQKYVPEARPLYSAIAGTQMEAIELGHSMARARHQQYRPSIVAHSWHRDSDAVTAAIKKSVLVSGMVPGVVILTDLHVSADRTRDVDLYVPHDPAPAKQQWGVIAADDRGTQSAAEFYGEDAESAGDDDDLHKYVYSVPFHAQLGKPARARGVKTIKLEKKRRRTQVV